MHDRAKLGGAKFLKIGERYIFSLSITFALTTFTLSFYTASGLDLFVSIYIVEFFILTLVHSPFNQKAQRTINLIGYSLFGIFIIIVALKVLQILAGVSI